MSEFKRFNVDKACEYSVIYRQKRQHTKQKLVEELIILQLSQPLKTLVGSKIYLPSYYRSKTIESVLNDLGYTLSSYNISELRGLYGKVYNAKSTIFSFVPKDS